jgi:hypothetical protein
MAVPQNHGQEAMPQNHSRGAAARKVKIKNVK